MSITKIVMSALLIAAIAVPGLAAGDANKSYSLSQISGTMYKGGATALDKAEGAMSGLFKRTFGLFNPCLDMVKGCTDRILSPIEKPFAYVENAMFKPKARGTTKVPAPKKPEIGK
jgi:hypothetical protein